MIKTMMKTMMKKITMVAVAGILACALAACGGTGSATTQAHGTTAVNENENSPGSTAVAEESTETASAQNTETESQENTKTITTQGSSLVVYFSWSGNTRNVAEEIGKQTGADLFELVPSTPYSEDYDTVLEEAQNEQNENARPEISETIDGFENYDVIYLGYPNWWGDMPMIIYSFLDDYDLSGKTIVPFCTSGGSGFSGSLNTIRSLEPEAEVLEGLSLGSSEASHPSNAVSEWLDSNGIER